MGDIVFYAQEMESKIKEIELIVGKLRALGSRQEKSDAAARANAKLSALGTTRRIYNMELRQMDKEAKQPFAAKLQAYDDQCDRLRTEIKWVNNEITAGDTGDARSALFGGAAERSAANGTALTKDGEPPSREALLGAANSVQDKTEAALQRTLEVANETNSVGDAIMTDLAGQTEQITKINRGLEEIDSELDKAKDVMASFLKRMKTDKLILVFVVLIILAVVGLVIYLAVR